MVTKSLSPQWFSWSNMSLSYEANHIDSGKETSHSHHVSLQSLQRNNILSGTYAKWLCSIHLSCGKRVSLVNRHKLILISVIKLSKHAKWLSSSDTLSFEFWFSVTVQKVQNQKIVPVLDQNSGIHNQNHYNSLI